MPHENTNRAARKSRCPLCGEPAVATEHAPFCSRGCRDRDLLKWLGEGYRLPGPAADPDAGDIPLDKTGD